MESKEKDRADNRRSSVRIQRCDEQCCRLKCAFRVLQYFIFIERIFEIQTPLPQPTSRILTEAQKTGRAKPTANGTVRFVSRKEDGIESRIFYHGLLPREDISRLLRQNGDFLLRTTSNVEVGFQPQVTSASATPKTRRKLKIFKKGVVPYLPNWTELN